MTVVGTGWAEMGLKLFTLGPVRIDEGSICSKPWLVATCSMDLKYCMKQRILDTGQFGAEDWHEAYLDGLHL